MNEETTRRPSSSIQHTASDRTKRIMALLKFDQNVNDVGGCPSSKCMKLKIGYCKPTKVGYTQNLNARRKNWKLEKPSKKEVDLFQANEDISSQVKPVEIEEKTVKEVKQEISPKDSLLCKLCFTAPFNTAFLECGHAVACITCVEKVNRCPICRKEIKTVIRIFTS